MKPQVVTSKINNQHVVPRNGGWAVKRAGASRDTKFFSTQSEAKKLATNIARKNKAEMFIHSKTGKIRERRSFGFKSYSTKE